MERRRLAVAKIAQHSGGRRLFSIVHNPIMVLVGCLDAWMLGLLI